MMSEVKNKCDSLRISNKSFSSSIAPTETNIGEKQKKTYLLGQQSNHMTHEHELTAMLRTSYHGLNVTLVA